MLEIKNLTKTFGTQTVISDVSGIFYPGKIYGFVGRNGSGKTVLMKMILGFIKPTSGTIKVNGKQVGKEIDIPDDIGAIIETPGFLPEYSAFQNLKLMAMIRGKITNERIRETIKLVGLDPDSKKHVGKYSLGMRQRLGIAQAIMEDPQILLLDEPFAAIDAKVRQELRSWLKEMIEQLGVTSIFVTHDQDEAIEVADEIIITNKGRIEQMGTPLDVYQKPQTAFTASFFGQTSIIEDYQAFHTFEKIEGAEKAIVRPEFVKITKKNEVQKYRSSASKGVVEHVSFRGDKMELRVRVNDTVLLAKRDLEENRIFVGETVDVFLYRIFVTVGDKAYLLENQSLQENSVVI